MSPLKVKKDLCNLLVCNAHGAKQKTCANELSLISYAPITQRLKVQQPQMNQFWPAVRQFPAQNFKGKHTC